VGNRKILIWVALFLLWGCTAEEEIWSASLDIENQEWSYDDPLTTSWTAPSDVPVSHLLIEVVHTPDFRYQNLYMRGNFEIPDHDFKQKDTFSVQLATRNSGRWLGERISDHQWKKTDTLMTLPPVSKGETILLSLEQFSRDSVIRNLSQIRWRLIEAGTAE